MINSAALCKDREEPNEQIKPTHRRRARGLLYGRDESHIYDIRKIVQQTTNFLTVQWCKMK